MHTQKASYAEWLSDRRESATLRPLTVNEQRAFENGYGANARAAVALARAVAGVGRKQATDIVHGAIGRMTYAVLQNKKSVPETAAAFRSWFLAYVRNVALKVGAAPGAFRPKGPRT